MKYKYVSKLHNLIINQKLNKGIQIYDNFRLSNSNSLFEEHFNFQFFRMLIGKLEFDDLINSNYLYAVGDLNEDLTEENMRFKFLNKYLILSQRFCNCLWLIKDNSVNIQNGFLYVSGNEVDQSVTSNIRTPFFLTARGAIDETLFTNDEIKEAMRLYNYLFDEKEFIERSQEDQNRILYNSPKRIEKFFYFLQTARVQEFLPTRIALYCTLVEILFSTETSEITHKISERVSRFLGSDYTERLHYFDQIKNAYNVRSTTIHGSNLKGSLKNEENLINISVELDNLLRKAIIKIIQNQELHAIFSGNENELNLWFKELILK